MRAPLLDDSVGLCLAVCLVASSVLPSDALAQSAAHPGQGAAGPPDTEQSAPIPVQSLASQLAVGDLVFIRIPAKPFREVAAATDSWTNHVGIVVAIDGREPVIAESAFPLSGTTALSRFIQRSEGGRVEVRRLNVELTAGQRQRMRAAADRRRGILYDTGFDLHSRRQFCSRYVREVVAEATGIELGEKETFAELLKKQPDFDLTFWRFWYFGSIPWSRETVTPASLLRSPELHLVFAGSVVTKRWL
jgi:hypothetical protein